MSRELDVGIRPAAGERRERRLGGELAAAQGEAQAIAGHRIDEPGGIAGQQQPGRTAGRALDGERAEADGPRHRCERGRSGRQAADRCAGCRAAAQPDREAPRDRQSPRRRWSLPRQAARCQCSVRCAGASRRSDQRAVGRADVCRSRRRPPIAAAAAHAAPGRARVRRATLAPSAAITIARAQRTLPAAGATTTTPLTRPPSTIGACTSTPSSTHAPAARAAATSASVEPSAARACCPAAPSP